MLASDVRQLLLYKHGSESAELPAGSEMFYSHNNKHHNESAEKLFVLYYALYKL